MPRTIHTILSQDKSLLAAALELDDSTARVEVQCLLQHVMGVGRAYLFAHPERVLNETEDARYQALLLRRKNGEPIAYIFGEREFFGLSFGVTPDTLIPRADTELLVELVLQSLPPVSAMKEEGCSMRVLDMGTGSGAIALSVAHQRPDVDVWACDASVAALDVARSNAQGLNIRTVKFVESNWFSAFNGQHFDIIVSNPPYIAANDHHLSQGDVRFEPLSALASGPDGLDDIRHIVAQAGAYLETNGWLMFEHGYDQAAQVRALLQTSGFVAVFSMKDLSGIERCSGGRFLG